jgi:hypothetical protein
MSTPTTPPLIIDVAIDPCGGGVKHDYYIVSKTGPIVSGLEICSFDTREQRVLLYIDKELEKNPTAIVRLCWWPMPATFREAIGKRSRVEIVDP